MAEKKWEKNVIYQTPPHPHHPKDAAPSSELYHVNDNVLKGAFCFTAAWVTEPTPVREGPEKSHYHDYSEFLIFIGGNPNDIRELGGEIEFWIEDEKYMINKSCIIFLPAEVRHCPIIIHKVDKPFLFCSSLPGPEHSGHDAPVPKSFVAPKKN